MIRGNHDKAACGIEDGSHFNHIARLAALWTGEALSDEQPRVPARAAGRPDDDRRRASRSVTARRSTRTTTSSTPTTRAARSTRRARPLCLFGHTHLPVVFRRDSTTFDGFVPDEGETDVRAHRGRPLPDQPGIGRPAARRRPARGVRDLRLGGTVGCSCGAFRTPSTPRSAASSTPDCRRASPTAWRSGGSGGYGGNGDSAVHGVNGDNGERDTLLFLR